MTRRQLQKRARDIIGLHLAMCGLSWKCLRIFVREGLSTDRGACWAAVRVLRGATFTLSLDSELLNGEGPPLDSLIGHEVGHIVLNGCQLKYGAEERACDVIGRILARTK